MNRLRCPWAHTAVKSALAFAQTHVGRVREINEDAYVADDVHGIYAVADGAGGAAHGELASRTAIARARGSILEDIASVKRPLAPRELAKVARRAVERACAAVHTLAAPDGEKAGAATTLTLLLVDGAHAVMAHVGDSRLYLLRRGKLEQLSADHTVANELFRAGHLSLLEARLHPFRNVLSRSLGPQRSVVVDILPLHLVPGDVLMLATDGLDSVIEEGGGLRSILRTDDLEGSASRLIDRTVELGGKDNATVVLVEVEDVAHDPYASAVHLLASVEPFAGLDLASRSRVVGAGVVDTLAAGETLLEHGDPLGGLWLVVEGTVAWNGDVSVELERGEWFGAGALVADRRSPAHVAAIGKVTVFHLPQEGWRRLSRRRPLVGVAVLSRLAASAVGRAPDGDPHAEAASSPPEHAAGSQTSS